MYKLRELKKEDITKINMWRNDKALIDFLETTFRYINIDVDYEWYRGYMNNRNTQVRCAIVEDKHEDEILGLVNLTKIDAVNRTGELSIMIGDKEKQGKGMGYFAVKTMLNHAFINLNLNRVELELLESNKRALNLYKKAGFIEEGLKKQAVYKNGEYIDVIIMAVLKENYVKQNLG